MSTIEENPCAPKFSLILGDWASENIGKNS